MVKLFNDAERGAINEATARAQSTTRVDIRFVAVRSSSSYQAYVLAFGLIVGTLVALILAYRLHIQTPVFLFSLQLVIAISIDVLHYFGGLFTFVVPRRIRRRRASIEAVHTFHALVAHEEKDVALCLLFVSKAERYVRVMTSPALHAHMPDDWHLVTDEFARLAAGGSLVPASTSALKAIGKRLAARFPL